MALNAATSTKLGEWFRRSAKSASPDTSAANPVTTGATDPAVNNSAFTPGATVDAGGGLKMKTMFSTADAPGGLLASESQGTPEMSTPDPAPPPAPKSNVTTLDVDNLTARNVGPDELVQNRITGMLANGSDYLEGFKKRAQTTANSRGLENSTMAASAGEAAAADAALPIATADAGAYGKSADYNTALANQGEMYNTEAQNKMSLAELDAAVQKEVTRMQTEASMANANASASATMAAASSSAGASRYSADTQSRIASEGNVSRAEQARLDRESAMERQNAANRASIVNNIINNPDIPPERRAGLLEALGEHGLASAIYVIDSTTPDLTGGGGPNAITSYINTPGHDYGSGG